MKTNNVTPAEIRAYRAENPKLRERDIAANLGISEAALVAAECGLTAIRIDADPNKLLARAPELGEVMALSRNENAVHEKIGVYENIEVGEKTSLTLGENIDLRIFNWVWAHAFAVTKTDGDQVRRSLQYFDKSGEAIHKVHLRPASDVAAYERIVADFRLEDQSQEFVAEAFTKLNRGRTEGFDVAELRDSWSKMTDTHEFFGLLRKLDVDRQAAVRSVGDDFAWKLSEDAANEFFAKAAEKGLDIMCFVANRGIVQIHTGPVKNIQTMGPWLNVMDPTFHLHLRADRIAEAWAVRKPTKDGHVTSLEAYDADGEMIIQFFGKRKEGNAEMAEWRSLIESLATGSKAVAA
ncbi:hemin-degrading factor [Rhizobium alvei]|jgi:putative hemin transport protein|uniref:ChuX/HutX family heme-like substrate-binding protein n=1 Tax=Rhizobium alvei TaxID=1132659 RepID=A0ABT8YGD3_9HYPH|nr:ChuX/HutX family heme-like substrate-binding protein [Rhizobium alvei]MDO6962408.1 ChuX/HutX family heme-like substrate-binding protein [Rhizobium alvei]